MNIVFKILNFLCFLLSVAIIIPIAILMFICGVIMQGCYFINSYAMRLRICFMTDREHKQYCRNMIEEVRDVGRTFWDRI